MKVYKLKAKHCLDNEAFVVGGGGGAAKTGVRNSVEVLELCRQKRKCIASSIDQLDTGKDAVMSMSVASIKQGNCVLAVSLSSRCCIYEVEKRSRSTDNKNETHSKGLSQRKKTSEKSKQLPNQGVSHYRFKLIHEINTIPGEGAFQTCVRLNKDASMMVSGGSDGHVRIWRLPSKEKVLDNQGHADDVTDIDISTNSELLLSVSRDGKAYLWDLTLNAKILNLHSIWKAGAVCEQQQRIRNCRFGVVPDHPDRVWFFTTHCPLKPDPKIKTNCYITRWAKKRDQEGKEVGSYLPAIVRKTGNETISTITISSNGVFVGVGFMEGSVAIYISFSLQCARRVKNVHSIFVTSLSFLNNSPRTRALTGDCDAALVSVSADCTCHVTKLGARTMFTLWFVVFVSFFTLIGVALYLQQVGFL